MGNSLSNSAQPPLPVTSATPVIGAPNWSMAPFEDFLQYTERLIQLMHLSIRGISIIRATPQVIRAVAKAEGTLSELSTGQRIERAQAEAQLAQREVDEGFPVLHAQATIALWGALENMVRLFLARWLENYPGALQADAVQRLRVRIGEYESLRGEDRFFYILDQLERELSSPLRAGVARFESLLEPFQLTGPIDEMIRQHIFELGHVRNVHVHRGGVADRRFVEACPWLGFAVGDPVVIRSDAFRSYSNSVHAYVVELIARVGERFGANMSEFRHGRTQDTESGEQADAR